MTGPETDYRDVLDLEREVEQLRAELGTARIALSNCRTVLRDRGWTDQHPMMKRILKAHELQYTPRHASACIRYRYMSRQCWLSIISIIHAVNFRLLAKMVYCELMIGLIIYS